MKIETKCIQSGYEPKNGEPRVLPIAMSTTFKYDSVETVGNLFDLKEEGFFYTRLANPTVAAVESKIADLEGGTVAVMTSSGNSATMLAVLNICSSGDRILCASQIYGGTLNLFGVTLKKLGIETDFVDITNFDAVKKAIQPNTKLIFIETISNPATVVADITKLSEIAHSQNIPLMIDNTFATAIECRPLEYGADIVVYSSSKYLDGHAISLGGVVVDGGKFDWEKSGKFSCLVDEDPSYHGLSYTKAFKNSAYGIKLRVQLLRDMGPAPSPMNAFLLNVGLETLHLRVPRHGENAQKVAEFLQKDKNVKKVNYPGLKSSPDYENCKKYLNGWGSGVISIDLGSYEKAVKFTNGLKLIKIVVHVCDARTSVLHPASSTHRQLTKEQLIGAGISDGLVRISVGIENAQDIIDDLKQSLDNL